MFSFWLGLFWSLFETKHWLMFSNSWFTIWKKYLISLCVKKSWCRLQTLLGPICLKHFLSRSLMKEIGVVLKLSLVEHHNWSSLSLFFLFHWFERIVSYLRSSFWVIHILCPLIRNISNLYFSGSASLFLKSNNFFLEKK